MFSQKLVHTHPKLQAAIIQAKVQWEKIEETKPFITCSYRSPDEPVFCNPTDGRKHKNIKPEHLLKHTKYPSQGIDIAFLKKDGKIDWSIKLYEDFFHLMKTFEPSIKWGGIHDYCHIEI